MGRIQMEITSIKVKREEREGSHMKGRASVVIDNGLAIHNIRIIEGKNGLFIAMPSTSREVENEEGETVTVHRDIVHPINQEIRTMFEEKILKAYEEAETDAEE
jgi:stage V sporulation protein G